MNEIFSTIVLAAALVSAVILPAAVVRTRTDTDREAAPLRHPSTQDGRDYIGNSHRATRENGSGQ